MGPAGPEEVGEELVVGPAGPEEVREEGLEQKELMGLVSEFLGIALFRFLDFGLVLPFYFPIAGSTNVEV